VNNLATLYQRQGRYGEAEPLYRRALEASERTLGREHPDTLTSANNLAAQHRRACRARQRDTQDATQALSGKKKSEAERKSGEFLGLVKAVYHLAPEGRSPDAASSREMFETAQ
jgi:hypothetical protein